MNETQKELTPTEKELTTLRDEIGQVFFDTGRVAYEIELKEQERRDLSTKWHNLNQRALKLQKKLREEMAVELPKAQEATKEPEQPRLEVVL